MFEYVDPFIGTGATELPPPQGLAATWWWPKPQVGNTHPGATYPFGMVSACAYSGAYPTGYGLYELNTEGVPPRMYDGRSPPGSPTSSSPAPARSASTTTTSASPRCWSRSTPSATAWELTDEARRARLLRGHAVARASAARSPSARGARSTATRSRPTATPGWSSTSPWAGWPSRTAPPFRCGRTWSRSSPGVAQAEMVVEGAPLAVHLECDAGDWRQLLWYDRRLDARRHPARLRPDPADHAAPVRSDVARTDPGPVRCVELRFGFSLRGVEQAQAEPARRLRTAPAPVRPAFDDPPRRHRRRLARAPRADPRGDPVRASGGRSSPPRSTTR